MGGMLGNLKADIDALKIAKPMQMESSSEEGSESREERKDDDDEILEDSSLDGSNDLNISDGPKQK